jgi:pimeloyl-ACP methyl ester carboxylesterase
MQTVLKFFLLVLAGWAGTAAAQSPSRAEVRPTVVLVHGAFAESASWDAVTGGLLKDGYPVIAVANPLRGVKADSSYLLSLLRSVPGEVILVGHSYAGIVMTEAAGDAPNVKSLVYVAGYAPDVGESAASRSHANFLREPLVQLSLRQSPTPMAARISTSTRASSGHSLRLTSPKQMPSRWLRHNAPSLRQLLLNRLRPQLGRRSLPGSSTEPATRTSRDRL